MDGTFRRDGNTGEAPQQALTDFASTPAGVLVLYVQDEVFHLERKFVGVAIRTSASVREPLHAAFLITIENLIAGLAGDAKPPTKSPPRPAGERASHKLQSFIHYRTLLPRHHYLPFYRESVSPMCPVQCVTYVSGRSFNDLASSFPLAILGLCPILCPASSKTGSLAGSSRQRIAACFACDRIWL